MRASTRRPATARQRRISQKAVTSISSIGGGGGGVTAALQSGVLRFFDEFRYDRIGINCQLRNDVCLMTGVEPHGDGLLHRQGQRPAAHRHHRQRRAGRLAAARDADRAGHAQRGT